ncbi:hypothetical protein B1R94_03195 [Mycolicibacterium litorale]|nr:hypothetical protein B1R94_03195 [Mycolicibacterium litorale]
MITTERVTRGGALAVVITVSSLSVLGCPVARSDTAPGLEFRHALVVGGSGNPMPSQQMMHGLFEQGIVDDPEPVGVRYPADLWPVHGKLTLDQSVAVGVANLDAALAESAEPVTVVGISQGAVVINYEKRALMAQSDPSPDISFVTIGDPTNSDGGLLAKLPHLHIPVLDVTIPQAPVDTPYDTIEIVHEYDGYADFPDNPLNILAVFNALAGVVYEHPNKGGVDLSDPSNVVTVSTNSLGGTTTHVLVPTDELPLTRPLRALGVPDQVVDWLDRPLRRMINTGYRGERPGRAGRHSGVGKSRTQGAARTAAHDHGSTGHPKGSKRP